MFCSQHKSILFLLPVIFMILFSCNNSISSELNEYNSNFTDSDSIPAEPGEPDFHSGQLFSVDEYFLYDDSILILSAPKSTHSIKWVFTDPDNKYETVKVRIRIGTDSNGNIIKYEGTEFDVQRLELYVPESNLEAPKTYKLTLTVTDSEGGTYQDDCGIVIYKRYNR